MLHSCRVSIVVARRGAGSTAARQTLAHPDGRLLMVTVTPDDPFLVRDGEARISREGFRAVIQSRAAVEVRDERDPGEYYDAILATRTEDGRFVDPLLMLAKF